MGRVLRTSTVALSLLLLAGCSQPAPEPTPPAPAQVRPAATESAVTTVAAQQSPPAATGTGVPADALFPQGDLTLDFSV